MASEIGARSRGRAARGKTPRAVLARVADADKSDRLTPALGVRREWARKRYEFLPKAKEIVGLPASS